MKKLTVIKALLIIWLRFINVTKSATENASKAIERLDATLERAAKKAVSMPRKIIFHADDFIGKHMKKTLFARGIIVILYKLKLKKSKFGNIYILPILSHVVTACINPPDSADGKANRAVEIQIAAAGLLYLTILPALYGTVLTNLIAAMRSAKGANQIIQAWRNLKAQLDKIMLLVQEFMNTQDPTQAAIVCEYYKFHVKGMGGSHAQVFEGEPGTHAGEIDLLFPVGPKGCSYSVKIYNTDRTSFAWNIGTDQSEQTIGGFVSGSLQQVSVTIVSHGVVGTESQIIEVRAK